MTRASASLGTAIFFLVAPGSFAGLAPWWISHWRLNQPFFRFSPFRAAGVLILVVGLLAVLDSFARFALEGLGTPAPMLPTQSLVVNGLYRYVRNPMYLALLCVIFGQAFLLGNTALLVYGAMAWLLTHVFVLFYEEPTLRATFGAQYSGYCAHVPRWIPRFTPWRRKPAV